MDEPQTRMTDELEAVAQIIWEASHQGGVWKARMSWYRTSPEEQERSIRERGTHPDCFIDNRDVEQAFAAAKAILARTRSVEPPREMVERVRQAIVDTPVPESHREAEGDKFGASLWDTEIDALAESLAALLTSVRSQAIEMCAGVADAVGDDPSRSSHAQDAGDEIAASIRSLR